MIENPVRRSVGRYMRRAEQNHHMIGKFLHPGLIEKKQIAGLGLAPLTTDKYAVEILQRATVRKLGTPASAQVAFMEGAEVCANDFLAERVLVEIKAGHIRRYGFIAWPHFLKPD